MAAEGSARNVRSPLVVALELALAEALETRRRRSLELLERRATLRVVDGGRRTAA